MRLRYLEHKRKKRDIVVDEEGIFTKEGDILQVNTPKKEMPCEGDVRMINGKLYYCSEEVFPIDVSICAVWRLVTEKHLQHTFNHEDSDS